MSDYLTVDIDDLTVGEIEQIEDIIDASIDSIGQPGARKGRFLKAVAFVMRRRTDPDFTLEQAANLRIKLGEQAANPTGGGAANRAARRAQSQRHA